MVRRCQAHDRHAAVATLLPLAAPSARSLFSRSAVLLRRASLLPLSRFTGLPSTVSCSRVHSPTPPQATAPFGPAVPTAGSRSALVLSQHLDGLLRIEHSRACCIPHPVLGFARFPAFRPRSPAEAVRGCRSPFPRARYTPRRIPLTHSRYASPRPVAFLTFPAAPSPSHTKVCSRPCRWFRAVLEAHDRKVAKAPSLSPLPGASPRASAR